MKSGSKSRKKTPPPPSEMDKLINEMKKKIQVSEGQRKALFEESEIEQKNNETKIETLKKEVSQLIITLRNKTSDVTKDRVKLPQLNSVAAYLGEKKCNEIIHILDLQVIDKVKKLDLIRYNSEQKEKELKKLAKEYQKLLSKEIKKKFVKKIEAPVKKTTFSLENEIHAVQVQYREANHIKNNYTDIRAVLISETAQFKNLIEKLEGEIQLQQNEIEKLQKVLNEATRMKTSIRSELVQEEKSSALSALERERLVTEGRRLVAEGRQELEKLEKHIFFVGKIQKKNEDEVVDEIQEDEDASPSPTPQHELIETFEKLKEIAGAKDANETLEKFQLQKTTLARLQTLQNTSETQKKKLEKRIQLLTNQLEAFKFAEVKDAEQNVEEMEKIRFEIDDQNSRKHITMEKIEKVHCTVSQIQENLERMYLNIHPKSAENGKKNMHEMISFLRISLTPLLNEEGIIQIEKVESQEIDEKWFPQSYNSLLRVPALQQSTIAAPQTPVIGSEEEEDVPTRDHLKKQAQMIVDAKSRKKVMRFSQRK